MKVSIIYRCDEIIGVIADKKEAIKYCEDNDPDGDDLMTDEYEVDALLEEKENEK